MFKNAIIYRLTADIDRDQLDAGLQKSGFLPCAPTQQSSSGFVPPRGIAHGPLAEFVGGHAILRLQIETRQVPSQTLDKRVRELSAAVEHDTGRRPGRKATKDLRERALLELLPKAFTRTKQVGMWIDFEDRLLVVDTGSSTAADDAVTLLLKAVDGLQLRPLQTRTSPVVAMANWLNTGEAPHGFSVDRECELKSQDEMKSVVRYARHSLDIDEVRTHIAQGKVPTRLSMTWAGRVSFQLTEQGTLKKIDFQDIVFEGRQGSADRPEEAFDTDAAIMTGELRELIADLVDALDGELQPGEVPGELCDQQTEEAA